MDLIALLALLLGLVVGGVLGSRYRAARAAGKTRPQAVAALLKRRPQTNLAGGPPAPRPGP